MTGTLHFDQFGPTQGPQIGVTKENSNLGVTPEIPRPKEGRSITESLRSVRKTSLTAMTHSIVLARITEGVRELETWTKPHAGFTDEDGEHPLPSSHDRCVHWKPTCDEAGQFMMNAALV